MPNPKITCAVVVLLLVISVAVAIAQGAIALPDNPSEWWSFLSLFRLPRVLGAVVIGALLAVAGVYIQILFRNPLAEPYVIGVSSGATVGAVLATLWVGYGLTLSAFVGSLSVCVFLWLISSRYSCIHLLLIGVAINSLGGALVALMSYWLPDEGLRRLWFWLLGGLQSMVWSSVVFGAALVVGSVAWGMYRHHSLDWLSLGETTARSHGVEVETLRRQALLWVAVMVAFSVSVAGMIGFVGLVVPCVVRLLVGGMNRWVIPLSALVGATVMVLTDWLCRILIAPQELPLGALTAVVGAPVLLLLLLRQSAVSRWGAGGD